MKTCSKCKTQKSLDFFSYDITRPGGYEAECKDCKKAAQSLRRQRKKQFYADYLRTHGTPHPETILSTREKKKKREAVRRHCYRKKYGQKERLVSRFKQYRAISVELYNQFLAQQNSRCAVCDTHNDRLVIKLRVNHDPEFVIRGLVCANCTEALEWLLRTPQRLENLMKFLGIK